MCFVVMRSRYRFIRAASGLLIPNPHIGDVAVLGISVEIATNIPFGVFAFNTCGDGVIPTIHGSAVKRKSDALSVALGKADPVVNVKDRLSRFFFRRFRWRRFLSCRRCGLFFSVGAAVSGRRSDSSVFFSGSLGCGSTAVLWSACSGTSVGWVALSDTLAGNSVTRFPVCDSVLWGRSTSVFFSA